MRRNIFRITAIMATALLAFAGVGCVEPLEPVERDPNARDLIIRLSVPGQGIPVTKAGTGPVNGISPESQVYTVQVWAFNHHAADSDAGDSEKAVAYSTVDLGTTGWANTVQRPSGYYDEWTNTTTYEVPMTFPGYVLDRDAADMKFDFYVLANASSIGCTAGQDATRGTLKSLSFGGDNFGTATPKTGATPTAILGTTGLPISGFFNKTKNAQGQSPYVGPAGGVDLSFLKTQPSITAAEMHKLVPVVQLQRAVSKIRFAFARPTGMTDIQITKIVIDGELIPTSTFVFPREDETEFALPSGSGYTTGAATIGSDTNPLFVVPSNYTGNDIITSVSDPEALKSNSEKKLTTDQAKTPSQMNAQEYDTFLSAHSTSQIAYLRESGKPITGKIYYKIGATSYEAPFTMEGLTNTNFHRNHYWTVYAYFEGGNILQIWTACNPWVLREETTSFSTQVSCRDIKVTGSIEDTQAYIDEHGDSNHDLSNYTTGEVPSTSDPNYYSRYYQVRRLNMSVSDPHFELTFTPSAPLGGYWLLVPEFIGEGSSDKFDIEVVGVAGGESNALMGQIINMPVTIHIKPKNYTYSTDEHSYAVILKCYFSPSRSFDPLLSADSEFQDVHRDGRFSYWRFTLTHGDY